MSDAVRQRLIEVNYLKVKGEFLVMSTGFTELDESPGAKTTSRRYINDKSESKSITGYDWSSGFTADHIPTKKVINYIAEIGKLLKTGADAETDYCIVDKDRPGTAPNTYHARFIHVAIELKDIKTKDGEQQLSGTLNGKGDFVEGTFDITTRTFTPGWTEPTIGTLTLTSAAGTTSGKTVVTVTPSLTSGNSYVYKTAPSLVLPDLNEEIDSELGYTTWDGLAEITATTGNKIMIVEITADSLAVKAGISTVTAKI